jgi:hypothetical protein
LVADILIIRNIQQLEVKLGTTMMQLTLDEITEIVADYD